MALRLQPTSKDRNMSRTLTNVPAAGLMAALLLTGSLAGVRADASGQEPGSRTMLVSVLDRRGAPVEGMTPADFRIRENGRNMTITSVAPSRTPMTIALMIDNSGAGLQSIREGAAAFVSRLRGAASIAIYTTSGRTLKVQDFTDSTATLIGAINKIYASNQQGAFLVDGIVATTREFQAAEAQRPVIMSVGVEGEDFSNARPNDVAAALQRTGTRLFMVRLGSPVLGQSRTLADVPSDSGLDEQMRFNAVLGQAPGRTGGRLEQLSAHSGIPVMMDNMAIELLTQYEVTYTTPNLGATDVRFEVSTSKRDVRVRGPQRIGQPK